jgi:hypothetical protein
MLRFTPAPVIVPAMLSPEPSLARITRLADRFLKVLTESAKQLTEASRRTVKRIRKRYFIDAPILAGP